MTKLIEYTNYKIKDMGKVITGRTPSTSISQYFGNQYMFITPGELSASNSTIKSSKRMLSQEGLQNIQSSMIDGISVLVGCIGWDMGNVGMCFEKCATNQQINSITKFNDDINPFYIYYWLTTKKEYLFQIAGVTRTPILNKSTFEAINIPIPTKSYQDKIANVLYALDSKIELNNKINQELEAMAQTLYNYWFTQFDFPDKNGKPYQSSGGKMVWNDKLKREIPEGWLSLALNSRFSFERGIEVGSKNYHTEKLPNTSLFYRISNINSICKTFVNTELLGNKILQPIDICVTFDGTIGKVDFGLTGGYSTGIRKIYDIENKINNAVIFTIFKSDHIQSVMNKYAVGSIILHASEAIHHLFIAFDTDVYLHYQSIVSPLFNQMLSNKLENEELTKTRDFLLPMLMSGQATVE